MAHGHRLPTVGQLSAVDEHLPRSFNIAKTAGAGGATTMMRATQPVCVHPPP
jgi:hypothetical protein